MNGVVSFERIVGLDLFSGIGGISLALEPYVRTSVYCEQDRYAQGVLLSRMASGDLDRAPIWDDIKTLSKEKLPEPVDIIFGGFPCQDISVAGAGRGLAGERSGLFFEIVRLTEEIKPTFLFLENVPAIRTRGLREVIRAFTDLRYDCRWTCVSAREVGAPHLRKRWFLLAHAHGSELRNGRERSAEGETKTNRFSRHNGSKESLADPNCKRLERQSGAGLARQWTRRKQVSNASLSSRDDWWAVEPDVCGMVDGLSQGLDGDKHGSKRMDTKKNKAIGAKKAMRDLRYIVAAWIASQGRKSEKQFAKKFADVMRFMPHERALEIRQTALANPSSYLYSLREAIAKIGALRDPSQPDDETWFALPEESQSWCVLAACRGPWHAEWPSVERVAQGIDSRIDRLRGLGNAVVPLQAQKAFERLIGFD